MNTTQTDFVTEYGPEGGAVPAGASEAGGGAEPVIVEHVPELTAEPAVSPGDVLKKAREARGEAVGDVARMLKLSPQQLEALENGRFDVLPGPTFVRGFLRNYARHLGMDPEPLLAGINARIPTAADLASMLKLDGNVQPAASPRPRSKRVLRWLLIIAVLALAGFGAAGVYLGWFGFRFISSAVTSAEGKPVEAERGGAAEAAREKIKTEVKADTLPPPVPVSLSAPQYASAAGIPPEQGAPQAQGVASAALGLPAAPAGGSGPEMGPQPKPDVSILRIFFNSNTLVQVRDSTGKVILGRAGTKGSAQSIKGKPPFSVMVKQPNNVKVEFDGQAVDLKGHTDKDGVARLTLK